MVSDDLSVRHPSRQRAESDLGRGRTEKPRWADARMRAGNLFEAQIMSPEARNNECRERRRLEQPRAEIEGLRNAVRTRTQHHTRALLHTESER